MKSIFAAGIALLSFLASHGWANLVVNGNFTAPTLAPWVASGVVVDGAGECALGDATQEGIITQEVTAPGEKHYYVSLRVTDHRADRVPHLTILADRANGTPIASYDNQTVERDYYGFAFQASVPVARLRIIGAGVSVSEVLMIELSRSPFAGDYTGTAKITARAGRDAVNLITSSKIERLKARVLPTGEFIMLRDSDHVGSGIILPDKVVAVRTHGERSHSVALSRGNQIKFSALRPLKDTFDEVRLFGAEMQIDFTLTRVVK